ncbi:hypothetical protein BC937DRAFT_95650 [Endogone sp. FLAS-F59071]|nr:hypothetical protein BC937DRAFT_95650 [Endogone sp. FLAS-F59071]|eukprot:RUS22876.1 hypothetical protein BC937DRAFT_95650 [Endogone sp. FLAS-F59071]
MSYSSVVQSPHFEARLLRARPSINHMDKFHVKTAEKLVLRLQRQMWKWHDSGGSGYDATGPRSRLPISRRSFIFARQMYSAVYTVCLSHFLSLSNEAISLFYTDAELIIVTTKN